MQVVNVKNRPKDNISRRFELFVCSNDLDFVRRAVTHCCITDTEIEVKK